MHLYFAGTPCSEETDQRLFDQIKNYRLFSYHYLTKSSAEKHINSKMYKNIMLDSGAFSAWSKNVLIDLNDYISFCKEFLTDITHIVNLDVIPAKPGVKKIPIVEIERSAFAGFRNYKKMKKALPPTKNPIHVFHQNENFKWLQRIMESSEYIGLSPANDRTTAEKIMWLDDCMKFVCTKKGHPLVKFHGFAVTSTRIMQRYPWYSVDSATWRILAGYSRVFIPNQKDGRWDFHPIPNIVVFSQIEKEKNHFKHLPQKKKDAVVSYINNLGLAIGKSSFELCDKNTFVKSEEKKQVTASSVKNLGMVPAPEGKIWVECIDIPGLCNQWKHRAFLNCYFLNSFSKNVKNDKFEIKTKKGFL